MTKFIKKTLPLFAKSHTEVTTVTNSLGAISPSSFVKINTMTATELKDGGVNLTINYQITHVLWGKIIIASTTVGVCYLAFIDDDEKEMQALKLLIDHFPKAHYHQQIDNFQQAALAVFQQQKHQSLKNISLHIKGTYFQHAVWQCLLTIPLGILTTYGEIARMINKPKACRAVGTAIGKNPVSFIIPCHRVIQSNGSIGGYLWGVEKKLAMIHWEEKQSYKTLM